MGHRGLTGLFTWWELPYHARMLRELAVQNLALIEDVRVELHPGFCAWTGETGAGKSLLLGALGLLLGERGSARPHPHRGRGAPRHRGVRPDAARAARGRGRVAAAHRSEDGQLVLTRRLSRSGRSSASVNETPVAVATLRRLGEMLVDVHGQRENYSLLQPAYQLELLDAFGRLADLRAKYVAAADRVRDAAVGDTASWPTPGSPASGSWRWSASSATSWTRPSSCPASSTRWAASARRSSTPRAWPGSRLPWPTGCYDEEGSVVEVLGRLLKDADRWAGLDPRLEDVARRLEALRPEVQDLAETCRDLSERFEADPARLEEVEKRIAFLKKLQAKYGKTGDELVDYLATLDGREKGLQRQETDLEAVDGELQGLHAELKESAAALSKQRAKVAKKLAADAQKHLADLGMPKAKLEAVLEVVALNDDPLAGDVPAFGIDQLELMLTANPGEPARPLRKVASGGELSRTMLALKTVLAAHDPVRTLVVFDEIDANVGGRLGDVLGQKLAALGQSHQVLCVTHLPQVASYAAHQWTIRKQTAGKRTTTTIAPLGESERVEELALMLRGESRSETTRREAAEMLQSAAKLRGGAR